MTFIDVYKDTIKNLDRFVIQLASMVNRFSVTLLVHGIGIVSLKLRHWLNLDILIVHPFRVYPKWVLRNI